MAINLTGTNASFTGNGIPSVYSPGFYVNSSDQIKVYVDGVLQSIGDDYTVSGVGDANGCNITGTFTNGAAVFIERVTEITQEVDTKNNETILEDVLDAEFDKLTMIAQEQDAKTNRAILAPKGESGFILPSKTSRASRVPSFDAQGDLNYDLKLSDVLNAIQNATAALANQAVASAVAFLNRGVNAISRTVQDRMREKVSVLDYIPTALHANLLAGTSTTDITPYINNILNEFAPYTGVAWSGVEITFPRGKFPIGSGGIDLTGRHGVRLKGKGRSTELFALGDHPVVKDTGGATTTAAIGVTKMVIRGFGNGSAAGDGINLDGTNRPHLEDLYFFACRRAVSSKNIWEGRASNLHSFGGGADRSSYGWYQDLSYLIGGYLNNAWNLTHSTFYDSLVTDFRVLNPQGSTYSDIRTGGSPTPGHIGNPGSAILVQWFHMTNCLFDTATTGPCLLFEQIAATELSQMHLNNIWVGNSPAELIKMTGCVDIFIGGIMAISAAKEAVKLVSCQRVAIGPIVSKFSNGLNGGYGCVKLEDSSDCIVGPVRDFPLFSAASVIETGTADNNLLHGLANGATLVGPSTKMGSSLGSIAFEYRNAGDVVGALVAGAANSAYLGLGTTANRLLHCIGRNTTGGIEVYTNSDRRLKVGNGVGASEFLVSTDTPFQPYVGTVAQVAALTPPAGSLAYATNGRKNGEGAGLGTGVLAFRDGTQWRACDTGATLAA